MNKYEKLAKVKRLREQRKLNALMKTRQAQEKKMKILSDQIEIREKKLDILRSYTKQKLVDSRQVESTTGGLMNLALGHYRRSREVIFIEIERRKTSKEVRDIASTATTQMNQWKLESQKRLQIEEEANQLSRIDGEMLESNAEESLLELATFGQNRE